MNCSQDSELGYRIIRSRRRTARWRRAGSVENSIILRFLCQTERCCVASSTFSIPKGIVMYQLTNTITALHRILGTVCLLILATLAGPQLQAQPQSYKLQTEFTGPNKCLDIVNDGNNNQLTMADCGNYSGQFWSMTPVQSAVYQLRTQFTGPNKCLDIVNDGNNNQLTMADCGNYSGQFWSMTPVQPSGAYQLRTQFTGSNKCLDIVNDGNNNQLIMADCGNYSGQLWWTR